MEEGFKAMVTGNLRSADAQKLNFTTAGIAQKEIMGMANGTRTAAQAFTGITKGVARHEKTIGIAMSKLNAGAGIQLSSAEMEKSSILSNMSYEEKQKYIKDEEDKKRKMSNDKLLKGQVDTVDRQIEINQEINKLVAEGIPAAQQGMIDVAEASLKAAKALARLAGVYKEEPAKPVANQMSSVGRDYAPSSPEEVNNANIALDDPGVSERDKAWLRQQLKNIEKREKGGPVDSSVPYIVGEKGPELFVPDTGGNIVPLDMAGNVSEYTQRSAQEIKSSVDEILKDYKAQQKSIDTQTTKMQQFSKVEERYFNKLTEFMNDVVNEVDNEGMPGVGQAFGQQSAGKTGLGGIMDIVNKMAGGNMSTAGSATALAQSGNMRTGAAQQAIMGGGTGLKSGGRPAAPGMGGGSGLTGGGGAAGSGNPNDLLRFGGHSGSASNFEALDDRLEKAVMLAASEYNSLTGNKLQINSAKRDPDDQVRLYQETIDAGRPGIGPTGMPVGRPGTSSHEKGLAVDIQNYSDPAAIKALNNQGLGQVVPKDPVHFQLSGEKGMIADGPDEGYQATLHGKEAVIPMQNNSGDFIKLFENMASDSKQMLAMMQEMVKAQKDSTSVANKMLRMQS
jgi:hypothetical protein